MTHDSIEKARDAALDFVEHADKMLMGRPYALISSPKDNKALRRQSMVLTHALVDLRRS